MDPTGGGFDSQPSILWLFHGLVPTHESRLTGVIQQSAVMCELLGSGSKSSELSLSLSLSLSRSLQDSTRERLGKWFERAERDEKIDEAPLHTLPDLTRQRGLLPGEPLPEEFGFFDDEGRPRTIQRRVSVKALRRLVADPDRVLDWIFREEVFDGDLPSETRAHFREEIEILNSQPWGATAYVDAVLADWPEDQEEMDVSVEAAERRLIEALDDVSSDD